MQVKQPVVCIASCHAPCQGLASHGLVMSFGYYGGNTGRHLRSHGWCRTLQSWQGGLWLGYPSTGVWVVCRPGEHLEGRYKQ